MIGMNQEVYDGAKKDLEAQKSQEPIKDRVAEIFQKLEETYASDTLNKIMIKQPLEMAWDPLESFITSVKGPNPKTFLTGVDNVVKDVVWDTPVDYWSKKFSKDEKKPE